MNRIVSKKICGKDDKKTVYGMSKHGRLVFAHLTSHIYLHVTLIKTTCQ